MCNALYYESTLQIKLSYSELKKLRHVQNTSTDFSVGGK